MKGQASIEFMIISILLVTLFMFSVFIFSEKNTELTLYNEQAQAQLIAKKLSRAVNNVHLSGDGTESEVVIAKGIDFNVSASGNALQVFWRGNFVDAALLTDNVTVNSASSGVVRVENQNGNVVIENA